MLSTNEKKTILSFLHRHPFAVIATVHRRKCAPEAALVAFCETENFELIFHTFCDTRKYENIRNNPRVAFVVGLGEEQITFQHEGLARELQVGVGEYKKYRTLFDSKKTPCTREFLDDPKSRLFVCEPVWFGYSDYTRSVPRVVEHFFD